MRNAARTLLWVYVFSLPWDHMLDFGNGIGEISRVLGVLSVVAAAGAVAATGRLRRPGVPHALAAGFFVSIVVPWFWTADQNATAGSIRTCVQTMAVMWQVWELAPTLPRLRSLLFAYVLGGYVSCVATIQDFQNTTFLKTGTRFKAEGWNENDLAVALAVGIPMAAYLGSTSAHRAVRWICWCYLLISPISIALTASRAGAVVAALGLASAFLPSLRGKKRARLAAVAVAAVLIAGSATIVPPTAWERILTLSPDMNDRLPLWEQSLRMFADQPLRPLGAGAFRSVSGATVYVTHNTFLGVLMEEGLVGFLCFGASLGFLGIRAVRLPSPERWLWYSVLLCWAAGALTLNWEQVRITWFIFGCAAAGVYSRVEVRYSCLTLPASAESRSTAGAQ